MVTCATVPAACGAQELARSVRTSVDNDYFNFWIPPRERPDDNYTQGMRIAWDTSWTPRFGRRLLCAGGAVCGATLEIGQEIYTPTVDNYWPLPGERSYAGWLYGRVEIRGARSAAVRSLGLTVGVTGAPSLAGTAQNAFHNLAADFRRPLGWDYQLPTEVAFAARAAQSWRVAPSGRAGRYVDLLPAVSATGGTLRTAAAGGIRVRVGAPLAHPWLAVDRSALSVYLFAGTSAEIVARDLFLHGSTFRRSVHVSPEVLLAEWERGVGVRVRRVFLEYRAVTRTREYTTGPRSHTYSSLALAWTLK